LLCHDLKKFLFFGLSAPSVLLALVLVVQEPLKTAQVMSRACGKEAVLGKTWSLPLDSYLCGLCLPSTGIIGMHCPTGLNEYLKVFGSVHDA
jgi:hypothetical protein